MVQTGPQLQYVGMHTWTPQKTNAKHLTHPMVADINISFQVYKVGRQDICAKGIGQEMLSCAYCLLHQAREKKHPRLQSPHFVNVE